MRSAIACCSAVPSSQRFWPILWQQELPPIIRIKNTHAYSMKTIYFSFQSHSFVISVIISLVVLFFVLCSIIFGFVYNWIFHFSIWLIPQLSPFGATPISKLFFGPLFRYFSCKKTKHKIDSPFMIFSFLLMLRELINDTHSLGVLFALESMPNKFKINVIKP